MASSTEKQKPQSGQGLYSEDSYAAKKKLAKAKEPLFLRLTHSLGRRAREKPNPKAKFSQEQLEVFDFLGWDIVPSEFQATASAILTQGIVLGAVLAGLFAFIIGPYFGLPFEASILAALGFVFIPVLASLLYQQYPKMAAEKERLLAIAYVPEIVNYLVMSMRLNPNLEKAVEFAASHGRGKIPGEMKGIIWGVQLGKYLSAEEGLDDLAYKWGAYNDDFKHALMVIRSSVLETNVERRLALLEKASSDVLEGSRDKMDMYARKLHQPTVFLYYFGILLPLLLAIVLPIGAAFSKGLAFAKPEYLIGIYLVAIPAGIWIYGNNILGGRPPTYVPPEIPDSFPGLPKKGRMRLGGVQISYALAALVVLAGFLFAGIALTQWDLAQIPEYDAERVLPTLPQVALPFGIVLYRFGIFSVIIGVAFAISAYLYGKYSARKKVQDGIRAMEAEFKDALYVLASRLGENRPMEDALRHAIEFLPKSKVASTVFRRILENITMLGMTLDAAIFDRTYGALKEVPSNTISAGMNIMADSVYLGVNVASKSLISLAMQIRNAQKVDEELRKLLEDITVMLNTMSAFIAPIVLAVVSSLQTVIINSLSGIGGQDSLDSGQSSTQLGGLSTSSISSILDSKALKENSATPGQFLIIMGLYVVEVVILLTYFNSRIEDTNNDLHTYMSIAKVLPVATSIFCAVAYFASSSLAGIG